MKSLDDIAEEAARGFGKSGITTLEGTIRTAIDQAIEHVLTREPSEAMRVAGNDALAVYLQKRADPAYGCYRAMQAALLEELKKKEEL